MAEDVKPTRKNLMAIEDRIELSERGHDTLEQKRDGLIMEFMDILDQAQDVRANLNQDYERAQNKINMARAMEGDVAVRGAASALKEYPEITTQSKNIMGVVVPQIESSRVKKSLDQRGYGLLGSSARIDEAADAYEELLESIILAAEVETAMKKMLEEIETTKRRVNALEFKLLPELYENQEYIEQKLEEQEREEIFRLKKIKAKKEEEEKEEAPEEEAEEERPKSPVALMGSSPYSLEDDLQRVADYAPEGGGDVVRPLSGRPPAASPRNEPGAGDCRSDCTRPRHRRATVRRGRSRARFPTPTARGPAGAARRTARLARDAPRGVTATGASRARGRRPAAGTGPPRRQLRRGGPRRPRSPPSATRRCCERTGRPFHPRSRDGSNVARFGGVRGGSHRQRVLRAEEEALRRRWSTGGCRRCHRTRRRAVRLSRSRW